MIEKFLSELENILKENNIDDNNILSSYQSLFDRYIRLGQSEFDIIRHFGEPKDIVKNYIDKGSLDLPDMDSDITYDIPTYLVKEESPKEDVKEDEKKESNIAPTTKAGLILNDILFVGLGLIIAIAGVIALTTVSVLMTAASVYQMVAVWKLATVGQRVGGFFFAIMVLLISVLFYIVVVWIVKAVIKFMKRYTRDHRENWSKCS